MFQMISRFSQMDVPDVRPGHEFELRMGVETTGEPEYEEARIEAILNTGCRMKVIVMPYLRQGFVLHSNQRDGHYNFWALLIGDTWKPIAYLRLTADEDLKGTGIRQIGSFTYYTHQGVKGVAIPIMANIIAHLEVPLPVKSRVLGKWQDLITQGWIYSFEVYFELDITSVETWSVSFTVPVGTVLYKRPWSDVIFDEEIGVIKLFKPVSELARKPTSTHSIGFQLLYPASLGQHPSLEILGDLKGWFIPRP